MVVVWLEARFQGSLKFRRALNNGDNFVIGKVIGVEPCWFQPPKVFSAAFVLYAGLIGRVGRVCVCVCVYIRRVCACVIPLCRWVGSVCLILSGDLCAGLVGRAFVILCGDLYAGKSFLTYIEVTR